MTGSLGITRSSCGSSFSSCVHKGRYSNARFPGSVTYRAIEQLLNRAHRPAAPFFFCNHTLATKTFNAFKTFGIPTKERQANS